MASTAVRRSAWLLYNRSVNTISSKLPTVAADPTQATMKMAKLSSFAAQFLIRNRGFCSKVKVSSSGKFNLDGKDELHSELLALLKSYDFSEVQINEIIQKYPKIISCRVSTNLKPKLDFLGECGFSGSILHTVVTSNPYIFQRSLHSSLKPKYQFLKTYLMDKVNMVIKRDPYILDGGYAEANVECLEKQGVPVSYVTKLLCSTPRLFCCIKNNRFVKLVETTKELGIQPSATMFVWYLRVIGSLSETSWRKKLEVFKSLGWSDEDVRSTLLHYPLCFNISEEKLRRVMDFYINKMKMEPETIIGCPNLLLFSLNGRIIPRYEVMKVLKEKDMLKSCRPSTFFSIPEKKFLRTYVEKNLDQVPHLLELYHGNGKSKAVLRD